MVKQLTKGKLLVIRSRTTGIILLAIMAFLIIGFVFTFNEPTVIQLTKDIQIPICPPLCDEFLDDALGLEVPIPEFEPRSLTMTPIITTTDDQGKEDTIRGKASFLQKITGLAITKVGTEATYDNGRLKIDLEIETDLEEAKQISLLGNLVLQRENEAFTLFGTLDHLVQQKEIGTPPTFTELDSVPISAVGLTSNKIFKTTIYDERIDNFVEDGTKEYEFLIKDLSVTFDLNEFTLENPTSIYKVTFTNEKPILNLPISEPFTSEPVTFPVTIVTQSVNATQPEIVQMIVPDVASVKCPDIKTDSVSLLFPTTAISGTTSLWGKTPEGFDQISMEVRNNRNCDLDLAIGSKWRSTSGTQYISDIKDIRIPTNGTVPIKTVPFDSTTECGGQCAGLEIQWCFFGQVSTSDSTEIIKELCGKKIYR